MSSEEIQLAKKFIKDAGELLETYVTKAATEGLDQAEVAKAINYLGYDPMTAAMRSIVMDERDWHSIDLDDEWSEKQREIRSTPPYDRIAFVGPMGGGKTTAAKILEPKFTRLSFANPLKELALDIFRFFETYGIGEFPMTREELDRAKVEEPMYRKFLQQLGTDFIRNKIDDDIWINAMLNKVEGEYENKSITIDDTRFENEVIALRQSGFAIIEVGHKGRTYGGHESEGGIDPKYIDHSFVGMTIGEITDELMSLV